MFQIIKNAFSIPFTSRIMCNYTNGSYHLCSHGASLHCMYKYTFVWVFQVNDKQRNTPSSSSFKSTAK